MPQNSNTRHSEANFNGSGSSGNLINSNAVMKKFGGRSDMWLHRRIKDGTLPPPIVIAGRRYWPEDEINGLVQKATDDRCLTKAVA